MSLCSSRLRSFKHAFAFSPRTAPEVLFEPCPSKQREQGMPGACCTRGLVCKRWSKGAHEHTGTAGALRHSLRNGFTAYAALSLETNSSCLHRCRLDSKIDPVGSTSPPAAWHQPRVSGPHGFSVRPTAVRLAPCTPSPITALRTPLSPYAASSTASRPTRSGEGSRPS